MITKPSTKKNTTEAEKLPLNVGERIDDDVNQHQLLVAALLQVPMKAHLEHLNTRSISRHLATDELYSDLPGIMDNYAEIVVRAYGEIPNKSPIDGYHDMSHDDHLHEVYEMVNRVYATIPDDAPCLEDSLGSIQSFLSGIRYKLERLTKA